MFGKYSCVSYSVKYKDKGGCCMDAFLSLHKRCTSIALADKIEANILKKPFAKHCLCPFALA